MSYMSSLETNARYSTAMSILNHVRHWLLQRDNTTLNNDTSRVLTESIELNQEPSLSSKIILYSFQGFGNHEDSAAMELSDALSKALNDIDEEKQKERLNALKKVLETKNLDSINSTEKEDVTKLITDTMYVISSQAEQKPENFFIKKDL